MIKCSRCGSMNPSSATYCWNDGALLKHPGIKPIAWSAALAAGAAAIGFASWYWYWAISRPPTPSNATNSPPQARAYAYPESGFSPLKVSFDGASSSDSDGYITHYNWSFGDGNVSTEQSPRHEYETAGTYTVTLTVTDDRSDRTTTMLKINVYTVVKESKISLVPLADIKYGQVEIEAGDSLTAVKYYLEQADPSVDIYNITCGGETFAVVGPKLAGEIDKLAPHLKLIIFAGGWLSQERVDRAGQYTVYKIKKDN